MLKFIFRLAFGISIAVSTAYLAIRADQLEAGKPTPWQVIAAASLLGLAALGDIVSVVLERLKSDRSEAFCRQVDQRVRGMWFAVMIEGYPLDTMMPVGVHVWLIPAWHWKLVPYRIRSRIPRLARWTLPTPAMWRPSEFRPKDETVSTNIYWRRGVGVIGKCWEDRDKVYLDYERDLGLALSEQQWDALPSDKRLGLKYRDYQKLSANYGQVLAVPITKKVPNLGHEFVVGCVAMDAPPAWKGKINLEGEKLTSTAKALAVDVGEMVV